MSSRKTIFLCRINHSSPTVWIDVSRANRAVLNVGNESCKCHPRLPLFLPLSPSFTSSFPILCCCHASHYIIYIGICQPLAAHFLTNIPTFFNRRKSFDSNNLAQNPARRFCANYRRRLYRFGLAITTQHTNNPEEKRLRTQLKP